MVNNTIKHMLSKSKVHCTSPVEGNTAKTTVTNVQLPLKQTNHIHDLCCFKKVALLSEKTYICRTKKETITDYAVMCLVTAERDGGSGPES